MVEIFAAFTDWFPDMALYDLHHYLFKLKSDAAMQASFASNPQGHLDAQSIDEEAKRAILQKDLATLWRLGVHPLLLTPLARFLGIPPASYRAQLRPLIGERHLKS